MTAFLKKLWFGEAHTLGAAAFLIAISSVVSRLLGVVRDHLLATNFGAGAQLDAYYAAFRLPDTLYNLLIVGALSSGFIPVFSEYVERRGKDEAMKLASRVLSLAGWTLAIASLLYIIFSPWIVPLITKGFTPDQVALTVNLSRIMGLSPVILGISAVMGGVLQATKRFFSFAIAPILYNVGIIIGIVFLSPTYGIAGVAWGVIIGAFFHLVAQATVTHSIGLRGFSLPTTKDEGIRRIIKLMIPRVAGLAITQINLIVLLAFAASLEAGSVSIFNLASNIQSFPFGVIGVSFAVAVFPLLTQTFNAKDEQGFSSAVSRIVQKTLFYAIPATILVILLRHDIVRLLFQNGSFDAADASQTATLLFWFALSLVAQCLVPIFTRVFYARQNTRTPLYILGATEVLTVLFSWILKNYFGVVGLAMAFSLSAVLQASALMVGAWIKYGIISGKEDRGVALRIMVASGFLVVWGSFTEQGLANVYPGDHLAHVAVRLMTISLVSGVGYLLIAWRLRVPEAIHARQAMTQFAKKERTS